jgi:hypothetical protein
MSSLQLRAKCASTTKPNNSNTSFENCFSVGLDLSEFTSSNNQNPSAAAQLIQLKAQEEKEDSELKQRIAQVHATSLNATAPTYELSVRAKNPHSDLTGRERDNNFLKFENGSNSLDNGFLSSLVQSHNSEKKELFHKSQKKSMLSKGKTVAKGNLCTRRFSTKGSCYKSSVGKKVPGKKATRSKY